MTEQVISKEKLLSLKRLNAFRIYSDSKVKETEIIEKKKMISKYNRDSQDEGKKNTEKQSNKYSKQKH